MQDLSTRRVKDSEDQLIGVVLLHLYPERVPPAKIWDYLTESTNRHADDFGSFWRSGLIDRSTPDDIAILLDELVTRRRDLEPALESRDLEEVPCELLARGLELCGAVVEHIRLLDWLRIDPFLDPAPTSHEATKTHWSVVGRASGDTENNRRRLREQEPVRLHRSRHPGDSLRRIAASRRRSLVSCSSPRGEVLEDCRSLSQSGARPWRVPRHSARPRA